MYHLKTNQKNGFTLFELMIVIIIAGIIMAVASPRLLNTVEYSRSAEATEAVGLLRRAADRCAEFIKVTTGAEDDFTKCDSFAEIGMENPGLNPKSSYSYVMWPYSNTVWKVVATQIKGTDIGSTITYEYCVTGTCPAGAGGGGGCFIAGTEITMSNGTTKPIEKIEVGDAVLSFDEQTGQMKEDTVKEVFSHPKEDMYLIVNGHLKVTPVHWVLTKGKWVSIGDLTVGDTLTNTKGEDVPIESIELVKESVNVYNFEVNPYHTYVANGLIVHNMARKKDAGKNDL